MQKFWFIAAGLLCQSGMSAGQERACGQLPDYPVRGGVSAPFAGMAGDWLIVAGGCNFPDKPAADGGKKAYYSEGYALRLRGDSVAEWQRLPDMPQTAAYGSCVETGDGLVCIGGMNGEKPLTAVFRIEASADGQFSIRPLPSLPEAIDNGAAAFAAGCIYVTAGNQEYGGKAMYRLKPDEDSAWERMADYPGLKRVQPVMLSEGGKIYLAGGFQYTKDDNVCALSQDMIEYDTATGSWSHCCRLPDDKEGVGRCLAGGSGVAAGGTLMFTGGVNSSVFKAAMEGKSGKDYMRHEPKWYKFNSDILAYDTAKQEWSVVYGVPCMARAGGVLVGYEGYLIMVCGEIKPGVRTSQVSISRFCGD